jgi:hypothetical protein
MRYGVQTRLENISEFFTVYISKVAKMANRSRVSAKMTGGIKSYIRCFFYFFKKFWH